MCGRFDAVTPELSAVVDAISALPPDFHGSGTIGARLIRALAEIGASRSFERTVETGAGRTTLLLSHLSRRHACFAMNSGGGSVDAVRASSLLRPGVVEFIDGPTQTTLPRYAFDAPIDLALLDGPHGFPFTQMEYWCVYPHLREGALLVVDDIHIPSVHMLYAFLRDDRMFRLVDVLEKTAIFERTDAPAVNPLGDSWWEQGYNAKHFPRRSGLPLITQAKLCVPERLVPSLQAAREWWRSRRRGRV